MRLSRLFFVITICSLLSSCFKEEPLNAECDIEEAWVHTDTLNDIFFDMTDTLVQVNSASYKIVFTKKTDADVSAMAPMFRLTEGATIVPANGSVHDFSDERQVQYTVTSQDGAWSRTYYVSFMPPEVPLEYNFENYRINEKPKYYAWYELDSKGTVRDLWATGNPGYAIPYNGNPPDEYPTVVLPQSIEGAGVKLTTLSTGRWGEIMNKRIAAGNLFLGSFNTEDVLRAPLMATCFGIRFNKEPLRLKGFYKYKPGETFQDSYGNEVAGRQDSAAIYSVLYRNHDTAGNAVMLHGDDAMTNPNIVAIARLWDVRYTDDWTAFDVEYIYKDAIDRNLLDSYGYNIAIVFSSSHDGDKFEGAVGSTLCIDKVSIVCNETEEEQKQ